MSNKTQKTQYEILGVDTSASSDDIKKAYRTLAKDTHPDLNGGKNGGFEAIKKAYEVLSDPKRRKVYDKLIGVVNSNPVFDKDYMADALRGYTYISNAPIWSTYSTPSTYNPTPRKAITIPRGLTINIAHANRYYGNTYPWGMTEIEAVISMNGVPWFGPDDVLRLEFDIQGSHGYLDIRVEEVSFSSSVRGGIEARVRGVKI